MCMLQIWLIGPIEKVYQFEISYFFFFFVKMYDFELGPTDRVFYMKACPSRFCKYILVCM